MEVFIKVAIRKTVVFFILMLSFASLKAQNTVGIGTATPDTNAVLHLVSTNGKQGLMVPKVDITSFSYSTAQEGMLVYDLPSQKFFFWGGSNWNEVGGSTLPPGTTGQTLRHNGTDWVVASNLINDGNNVGIGIVPNQKFQAGQGVNTTTSSFVDQSNYSSTCTYCQSIGFSGGVWQSFKPSVSADLYQIGLDLNGTTNISINIYEGVGNGGALLGSSSAVSSFGHVIYTIPTVSLTAGNDYTIELVSSVGFTSISYSSLNPYSAGESSLGASYDFYFETWMQTTTSTTSPILTVNEGSNAVGIGTEFPSATLDVNGDINLTKELRVNGNSGGFNQVLTSQGSGSAPIWKTPTNGDITGVTAGTGLTGGGLSGSVTLSADVGTTAGKLVQLDASARLPAVNASLLTNVPNIYNVDGSISSDRIVGLGAKSLSFTSTITNGFSVDGSTFSVDALNNRIGIGTAAPSAKLHIQSTVSPAFRLEDGTQSVGRILTSDANGNASWQNASLDWSMNGNAGVTSTNYLGPQNDVPLTFKIFDYQAGRIESSSYYGSTFLGYRAGHYNKGGNNTAIGNSALFNNVTGGKNVAVGMNALFTAPGANYNTAVGETSMYANETGEENTALGYNSLGQNTTGSQNTAIGVNAGASYAGGQLNTFVGYGAEAKTDYMTNATAIGANALVMDNDRVQLGNNASVQFDLSLMPAGDAGNAGEVLTSQGFGSAPIWTTPATGLTGSGAATRVAFWNGVSSLSSNANLYWNNTNSMLGIGTSSPAAKLHLSQTIATATPMLIINNGHASGSGAIRTTGGATHYIFGSDPSDNTFKIANSTTSLSNATRLTIDNLGNVGIGTTTPSSKLHVADNSSNPGVFVRQDGSGAAIQGNNYSTGDGIYGIASGGGAGVRAWTTGSGPALITEVQGGGTGHSALFMGGNVGIGTTNPLSNLHIHEPSTSTNYLRITNNTSGSSSTDGSLFGTNGTSTLVWNYENTSMLFGTSGATRMTILGTGEVGIGTTAPSEKLEVVGNIEIPAANDYKYATAKTDYITLSYADFISQDEDLRPLIMNSGVSAISPLGDVGMLAPVHLPNGAIITEVRFYVSSNNGATAVSNIYMYATNLAGGNTLTIASTTYSTTSTTVVQPVDNILANSTVSNSSYAYWLRVYVSSNTRVYGARITYTVTNAD